MTRPRRSTARSVPRRPPRRSSWRAVLLVGLLLGLLISSLGYWHYRRQINRYARRAWATFTANSLTGHEKTPLLDGYTVHGIDVSYYQGKIDWPLVARHNVRFAFIKASEGVSMRDPRFARNWREARAAGLYCGAYHYFQPNYDGTEQANLFVKTVPLQPGDLPPVLDVEAPEFHDVAVMRRHIGTWLRLVERHYGVRPILYSNYSFYQRYLAGHFDKYPLWLAHYEVEKPALPRKRWIIWQHSDEAYVPGIRGTVDFNVYQGSFEGLMALRIPARSRVRPGATATGSLR
ncbi:glycoside hydrolase family 25 protein [Hymenobacter busanensis]|uniref:Glycoside hydrolase family 25 protein n=1 Tax=Hymenobacter busanensis TaxID=2607656 RepID=A0A7L4ZXV8_9BACT|nr:glycoside hydrolase family 25 protein [Hymenobacter busanensis]KAA9332987.1 glycoside hydrolase family 25 protein [Hymenobacter busanensis]QHJ08339.1 glycoside hydrolase family 25 protein [Hymenobacter busanensis]